MLPCPTLSYPRQFAQLHSRFSYRISLPSDIISVRRVPVRISTHVDATIDFRLSISPIPRPIFQIQQQRHCYSSYCSSKCQDAGNDVSHKILRRLILRVDIRCRYAHGMTNRHDHTDADATFRIAAECTRYPGKHDGICHIGPLRGGSQCRLSVKRCERAYHDGEEGARVSGAMFVQQAK